MCSGSRRPKRAGPSPRRVSTPSSRPLRERRRPTRRTRRLRRRCRCRRRRRKRRARRGVPLRSSTAMTVGTAVRPDGRGREGGRPPRGAANAQGRRYARRSSISQMHERRSRAAMTSAIVPARSALQRSATSTRVKGHPDARGQIRAEIACAWHTRIAFPPQRNLVVVRKRTQSTDHCDAIPLGKHCVGTRQLSSISNLALHLLRANESKHREFFLTKTPPRGAPPVPTPSSNPRNSAPLWVVAPRSSRFAPPASSTAPVETARPARARIRDATARDATPCIAPRKIPHRKF